MKVPCGVIRDLLPLSAEGLASPESEALVAEHTAECADCRARLEELRMPREISAGSAAPMLKLKKELRRRRLRAAAMAALGVFLLLFALFSRATDPRPLDCFPELVKEVSLVPAEDGEQNDMAGAPGFLEDWKSARPGEALVIRRGEEARGMALEYDLDPETGELTAYIQYWGSGQGLLIDGGPSLVRFETDGGEDRLYPVPDRVIYGLGSEQTLLWGEPMSGSRVALPRLALAYYALLAGGLAAVLGLAWLALRKTRAAGLLGRLALVPASWLAGTALIKGLDTASLFLTRDLVMIALEAAAVYALAALALRSRGTE